jgi:hypothetical protein
LAMLRNYLGGLQLPKQQLSKAMKNSAAPHGEIE